MTIASVAFLFTGTMSAFGQNIRKAEWSCVKMDSTYDGTRGKSTKVIEKHQATSPGLLKPIGKCSKELKSHTLNKFVTDEMLAYAARSLARSTKNPQAEADVAIVKFRNKKVCIPAGDVTPLDIISLFPMDSRIIMFEMKGIHLRELIEKSAKKGIASSLAKESVEDERMYKVISIDYLLKEDVSSGIMEYAEKLQDTITYLSNTMIQHVKRVAQKGETI